MKNIPPNNPRPVRHMAKMSSMVGVSFYLEIKQAICQLEKVEDGRNVQ
jgi:hypothetical protein